MNIAEALLAADAGKITQAATAEFEVSRLTKLMGEPFVLHLKQIGNKRVKEIQEDSITIENGDTPTVDSYKLEMELICAGVADKDFDNMEVLKKFKAATRRDLFNKLLNAGEIHDIAEQISNLCGFSKKSLDKKAAEIKN